jgi:predicted AlkP superfamily pyrophosphatase or phosphodiesterase
MKKRRSFIVAIYLLLALICAAGTPPPPPHLILISIDGLVPDYYVKPDRLGLRVPHLRRMCREGAYSRGVIGVYPTVTYPSHTTLVTGAKPADHGIIANTVFDDPSQPPKKRWYWEASYIKTDTLWAAAKRSGLTVGSVFWPVTVGTDLMDWNLPEIWDPFADPIFSASVLMKYASPGLLEDILKSRKQTVKDYRHTDESAVDAAVYLIERSKPNLLLLHLIDLDHIHHTDGPFSGKALQQAEQEDAGVGRILEAIRRAGIQNSTTVAVVSDHGFMRIDTDFNPSVVLVQEGLIGLDEKGQVVSWQAAIHGDGGVAAVYLKHPEDSALAARVQKLFDAYTKGANPPLRRVLTREDLKRLGANPNAALFLEPAPHFQIRSKLKGPLVEPAREGSRGNHGYLPELPDMYASLILWGRGIQPKVKLELVHMTDIAPTLAQLLNIRFQPPDYSRPLSAVLAARGAGVDAQPMDRDK